MERITPLFSPGWRGQRHPVPAFSRPVVAFAAPCPPGLLVSGMGEEDGDAGRITDEMAAGNRFGLDPFAGQGAEGMMT